MQITKQDKQTCNLRTIRKATSLSLGLVIWLDLMLNMLTSLERKEN